MSKTAILYCEADAKVLSTQTKLFSQAGYAVVPIEGRAAMEAAVKAGGFDIAILGHTLTPRRPPSPAVHGEEEQPGSARGRAACQRTPSGRWMSPWIRASANGHCWRRLRMAAAQPVAI